MSSFQTIVNTARVEDSVVMRTFRQSFIVKSPIEKGWHFYRFQALEIVTPKEIELKTLALITKTLFRDRRYW